MFGAFYNFYKIDILRAINGGFLGYVSLFCMFLFILTGFMQLYLWSAILFVAILGITLYLGLRDAGK